MFAILMFLIISLAVVLGVSTPLGSQIKAAGNYTLSLQGYAGAEALNDDAFYRLNKGLSLPASISLYLNNSTSTATVSDVGSMKEVTSQGTAGSLIRTVRSSFKAGEGVAFNYGLQVGNGGFVMSGGATVNGNVYSNSDITGSGGPVITGTAIAANTSQPTADQTSSGSTTPLNTITIGTSASNQDFAQSFTVSTSSSLTEVRLFMKRTALFDNIPNATVRIMNDSSGKPGSTTYTSGTLSISQLTTSYGWVSISPTAYTLNASTTYWLVIDTSPWSYDVSKYISLAAESNIYANGSGKQGRVGTASSWVNPSPSTLDGYFEIYVGGDYGLINGIIIGTGSIGDAQAHTVNGSTVSGTIFCQSGSGNNKVCDTSRVDPSQNSNPISDGNITQWKEDAEAGTIRNSSWSLGGSTATSTPGPMKIIGNLSLGSGAVLTINGTLYVTGSITLSGSSMIVLGSSYGTSAGIIVTDGLVDIGAGGNISGNGNTGSYALLVTTNSCIQGVGSCSSNAIEASGGTGSVVLVAQNGGIKFSGGASAKSAAAYKIIMSGGTTLNYETGLANIDFSSGPGGAWNVDSWNEVVE